MRKVLDISLAVFAFIGFIFTALLIYVTYTDKDLYTNTTSTYALSVTDPQTGEEKPTFSLRYYENYNNSGLEVLDFMINCYSDYKRTALYSRGYQLITYSDGSTALYYYDTYDGESWPSLHKYDEVNDDEQHKESYYIDLSGGELCAIRLDGLYTVTTTEKNTALIWRAIGNSLYNFFTFNWIQGKFEDVCSVNVEKTTTHYYTYTELLQEMAKMCKGQSYGTGSFFMPLVDMGDYIHVYGVDDNGTVDDEPLGEGTLINAYYSIDCYYSRAGLSYAAQSLFGSVGEDSNYNTSGITWDVEFWKAAGVYYISEADFVPTYSQIDGGWYYSLSSSLISELQNYNLDIYINFDVSNFSNTTNVLGFYYYALYGLNIKELTITSETSRTFTLLLGSLKDTGLTADTINTSNITLVNSNSGVEL